MQIEISLDTHSIARASVKQALKIIVEDGLRNFRARLTRADLHLRDVNGERGGVDHRCTLEVRPAGLQPLCASCDATTAAGAVKGALEKINRQLASSFGKQAQITHLSASGMPT